MTAQPTTARPADTAPSPRPNRSRPGIGLQSTSHEFGPWFHNLHLPDGVQTAPDHPLGDFPRFKWLEIAPHLPDDLTGKRVLDVGCNAGFYTFELARRGAEVLGIDVEDHYLNQARWAAERFGLGERVRFQNMPVYRIGSLGETYDLVWFMGVFYHLRHPLLALDLVADVCRETLVFQTLTTPGDATANVPEDLEIHERHRMTEPGWPTMAFIEHRLASDPTNWWAANRSCVEAMLRSSGFQVTARPTDETYLCRSDATADDAARRLELSAIFS